MRKNYIDKMIKKANGMRLITLGFALLVFVGLKTISSCDRNKVANHDDRGAVKIDGDLSHLLKPTNSQVVSTLPIIKAEYGTRIFTAEVQGVINYDKRNENSIASKVGGRIERLLIKYNYQPVRKGQLIMEIYSPDLAAAQQELLFLQHAETDQSMLERAKQRLMLLGMNTAAVNQLLKTKKVSYRIPVYSHTDGYILEKSAAASVTIPSTTASSSGGDGMSSMGGGSTAPAAPAVSTQVNSPVMLREGQYVSAGQSLFTIYDVSSTLAEFSFKPALASLVKKGDKLMFYKTSDKSTAQNATIGMIQPVFKNVENFTIARIYLNKSSFRIGELLTAKIPVLLAPSWWLPECAIVSLGDRKVLFKKEGNVVVPKTIKTGITINGMVQITEDISNWEVSKNAAYLVDSESFIKK